MSSLHCLTFSQDDRLWRLRAWLLERVIILMAGDWRWALFGLACRMMSSALTRLRLRLVSMIRC